MAELPVIALDVGGAALRAARVASHGHQQKKHALLTADLLDVAFTTLPNHVATMSSGSHTLLGKELQEKERQRAKLHYMRPIERGYCVNWNTESELWTHLFSNKMMNVDPHAHALVATSPLFAPTVLNETMDQLVFEEFGFQAFARVSAAEMCVLSYAEHERRQAARREEPSLKRAKQTGASPAADDDEAVEDWSAFHRSSCQLVIDSGFSFTHVVPMIDGVVYQPGVKRINVGGKILTNYLKEIVSYRQWNVMDESIVINELKEALCYCSMNFDDEMKLYHRDRTARKHWTLPDFVRTFSGKLRAETSTQRPGAMDDDEQALEMGVEMITVPEVLFHPSDIGLDQAGLAEAVMQSVNACPADVRSTLLENILLVGGNIKFRNFRERLERDLRPLVPYEYQIRILQPNDPILAAAKGCVQFAVNERFTTRRVTKQEYEEYGSNICHERFL